MGADSSKHTREPLSDTTIQKLVSDFKCNFCLFLFFIIKIEIIIQIIYLFIFLLKYYYFQYYFLIQPRFYS